MPQSIPQRLSQEHVLKALADLDAGIDHPFGAPTKFELIHDGKRYAPKAAIGIAFRHAAGDILHPRAFSGGEAPGQANYELRRLGFTVTERASRSADNDSGQAWSDEEVGHLLADYFAMLKLDLHGADYNKAEHNRRLRESLAGRSKGSVEFKHQNVSAVMLKLGMPYIDGYKPARNYQRSLVDAVQSYLDSHSQLLSDLSEKADAPPGELPSLDHWDRLFETPPEGSPLPPAVTEPWKSRRGRKIDFVERDAANRLLGRQGEEFALELERRRLRTAGRDDLASRIEWISDTAGDGMGYDLMSFDESDDSEKLIEVKTTAYGKYFPFFVSRNEVRCSEAMAGQYHLYRLFSFARRPRLYVLHGALSERCQLEPVSYRATVGVEDQDAR